MMPLQLTSTAFNNGDMIPRKYSCDGEDISPPLQFKYISREKDKHEPLNTLQS